MDPINLTGNVYDSKTTERKNETLKIDDPHMYINREISWLRFNRRVLDEAFDSSQPLLERVKFLAICDSNLDEFFMVRVSALMKQLEKGALNLPADGKSPRKQLSDIRAECLKLTREYSRCWNDILVPQLKAAGINITKYDQLDVHEQQILNEYFDEQVYPVLTPLAMDLSHPFPFISNLSLNLAVTVRGPDGKERHARIKIPTDGFDRLVDVRDICSSERIDFMTDPHTKKVDNEVDGEFKYKFILLEDLVIANLDKLFHGYKIVSAYSFRITRDAEVEISTDQASDLLMAIEEGIESRRIGGANRLELDHRMPRGLAEIFARNLHLDGDMVYSYNCPLGLVDLWQMLDLDIPTLKDKPFIPHTPGHLEEGKNLFDEIRKRDYVLYHPYDSFNIISNLLKQAASDPDVLAIKITLYRIDHGSTIIQSLIDARQNGKAVAAIIELKAKFDEQHNIEWARSLEHAGVHVVYGLLDLKVHAKLLLIVRREGNKIVRYCHISSGNYNATTAHVYGDIGYLTANSDIGKDVSHFFNALTGYYHDYRYLHLIVSPHMLREEIIRRIIREIEVHRKDGGGGYIALKLNGLADSKIIQALYQASMAGVKIDLNVRGMCCLRPGVKGISDNISEISIVGRFLEHARIYYFRNGGQDEVLLGSSDLMPRNLDRRVEVLFPVPDQMLRRSIIDNILNTHLRDTVKARIMLENGEFHFRKDSINRAADLEKPFDSQNWLLQNRGKWHDYHG